MTATLRRLTQREASEVCDVFTATLVFGRPLPFPLDGVGWFASLAIGWYLLGRYRSGSIARQIRDHTDDRCRLAGLDGWVGEINARGGHRSAASARVAGIVTASATNRTLSRLVGEPVHRLTVVRWLDRAAEPTVRSASEACRVRTSG